MMMMIGIPYEITTYTSDIRGAGTEADVYVVLYGRDACTSQKSICANKNDRKKLFNKGEVAKFVVEVIFPHRSASLHSVSHHLFQRCKNFRHKNKRR